MPPVPVALQAAAQRRSRGLQRLYTLAAHIGQLSPAATPQPAGGSEPASVVAVAADPLGPLGRACAVAQHAVSRAGAVPSLAVAVSQYGTIIWEQAFGWATLGVTRATPRDTMYSLASVSKPFTASALMMLVEAGVIALDSPINLFLDPAAQITSRAGPAQGATVRRVANHSSGLPLHFNSYFASEVTEPATVQTAAADCEHRHAAVARPSSDEVIRRYGATITQPGEVWQYSNLGYGCLDNIIGRHCARDNGGERAFGTFLESDFCQPLGLTRTAVDAPPGHPLRHHLATRYSVGSVHQQGTMTALEDYTNDCPGAASVWASVHDVMRFGEFHCSAAGTHTHMWLSNDTGDRQSKRSRLDDLPPPLSAESRREMQRSTTPMPAPAGATAGYGIGWMITDHPSGHRLVHHGGGMMGVSTMLITAPEHGLVVVVLCNGRGPAELPQPATAVAEEVLCALLPGYAEHWDPWPTPARQVDSRRNSDGDALFRQIMDSLRGVWVGYVAIHNDGQPSQGVQRKFRIEIGPAGDDAENDDDSDGMCVWVQLDDNSEKRPLLLDRARMEALATAGPAHTPAISLCGFFEGDMGTVEADRRPHELHLTLRLRESDIDGGTDGRRRLDGGVTAQLEKSSGFRAAPSYPHPRASNGLTHWCKLRQCT